MRLRLGRPDLAQHTDLVSLPVARAGRLGVTFAGVSTLLVDDGSSAVLFDGFFTRPSLLRVGLGTVAPDPRAIDDGLARLGLGAGGPEVRAVVPVHSHFDHVMDSAEVARRTGAALTGGASTINVGLGADLPGHLLRQVSGGQSVDLDPFTLTFVESDHCPPDRYPGTIDTPLRPPARARAYRCGEAWSVLVQHRDGPSVLVQGSAGFVPHALDAVRAGVVYLGVGQLGVQRPEYLEAYWHHVVAAVGARRVVLTHWDDFFRPATLPLRALPYAGDDLDVTVAALRRFASADGVDLALPRVWVREDPVAIA